MLDIQVKGIELIEDENDQERIKELLNEYGPKIERMLDNDVVLEIHFKEYEKEGNRVKHSVSAKINYANNIFQASDFDWDLARVIHKVMKKLETEIEHKLHVSDQHDKNKNGF